MAKKEGTPALTAERVWTGIRDGSLEVRPISGTKTLFCIRGRLHLTWVEGGHKKSVRVRYSKVYLDPRWTPIARPEDIDSLRGLNQSELARKGVICIDNTLYRLIYHQVEDAFHYRRKFEQHILPQYDAEQKKLWSLLEEIEPGAALGGLLDERLEKIAATRPHMAARREAATQRLTILERRLERVRIAIQKALQQAPLGEKGGPLRGGNLDGAIRGLSNSLSACHQRLEILLEERPFDTKARSARNHMREAIAWLNIQDMNETRRHLIRALEYLVWPEERK